MKRLLTINCFAAFCLSFALFFLVPSCCKAEEYKQVPMQQWNQLIKTLQEQEIVLLQVKEKLTRLNSPSAKLLEQLEKSEKLCNQANSQLQQSQKELTNAQSSLKKAYSLIEELKVSCQELTKSLKVERAQAKKDKIKHGIIGVLIGIVIGAVVS